MNIAFYAPLKAPDHAVPSGDRRMARGLIRALRLAGHRVFVASALRSYLREPEPYLIAELEERAAGEVRRLSAGWAQQGAPDLFFCYHPYYRSPDLIGPPLCRRFDVPYLTAEASYAGKRDSGAWGPLQATVVEAVGMATLNLCFTERDREGLCRVAPADRQVLVPPFIELPPELPRATGSATGNRLVTAAMMRPGNKLESYRMLARVLRRLEHVPWTLDIIGAGPAEDAVRTAFADLPPRRLNWRGLLGPGSVAGALADADLFVWPGCDEAYGLVYLEAQAVGLPVIGQRSGGVPRVVQHGRGGILTPPGDEAALAAAIARLLADPAARGALAREGARFVREERSLSAVMGGLVERVHSALTDARNG